MTTRQPDNINPAQSMADQPPVALPDELVAIIDCFDQAWHQGQRPAIRDWWRPNGDDCQSERNRGLLLHELIQVDLEHRWRRTSVAATTIEGAAPPRIDDYLRDFPELGSIENQPLDLIAEEYRVRCRWGDRPAHSEYLARFPWQAEAVEASLAKVDRQLKGEGFDVECSPASHLPGNRRVAAMQSSCIRDPLATLRHADYRLQRRIGAGGMGKVYLALQTSQNRQVAVKVLKKSYWLRPGAVELFRQEAHIVSQLRHPGIVAIHGLGQFPRGGYFIVMDYLPGGELAVQGGLKPNSFNNVLRWVSEVAEALHFAHQHGVVHCDIKPSNVLLNTDGRAIVTDFGLARPVSADWTNFVELAGTAAYMAPEQIDNCWGAVGPTTDVHGLGGLLFALLTGQPPMMDRSVLNSLARIVAGETPRALSSFRAEVPRSIAELCEYCLQPDPKDRPPTASWVAHRLRERLPDADCP